MSDESTTTRAKEVAAEAGLDDVLERRPVGIVAQLLDLEGAWVARAHAVVVGRVQGAFAVSTHKHEAAADGAPDEVPQVVAIL